jgi:hypothetical protein
VWNVEDEFLERHWGPLDGHHCVQGPDVGGMDGGGHAGGKGAVAMVLVHVAVQNRAGRSRDVTVSIIWNEAAIQHVGAFCDLIVEGTSG